MSADVFSFVQIVVDKLVIVQLDHRDREAVMAKMEVSKIVFNNTLSLLMN